LTAERSYNYVAAVKFYLRLPQRLSAALGRRSCNYVSCVRRTCVGRCGESSKNNYFSKNKYFLLIFKNFQTKIIWFEREMLVLQ
jgi:hypothetical protein